MQLKERKLYQNLFFVEKNGAETFQTLDSIIRVFMSAVARYQFKLSKIIIFIILTIIH